MPKIEIHVDGMDFGPFRDKVKKLSESRPLLERIGKILVQQTKIRFNNSKDPKNIGWKDLKRRTKRDGNRRVMIKTGQLQRSIKHSVEGDVLSVGTDVEYGKYHQTGAPSNNLPKRQFLGLSRNDRAIIRREIERLFK